MTARRRALRGVIGVTMMATFVAGAPSGASADEGSTWTQELPTSVAALGDSITRGFNACGFYVDCARRSWSTGSDGVIDSHLERLQGAGAPIVAANNFARSGSRVEALPGQMAQAVAAGADYLTVEIGANDACRKDVAAMTPVSEFRTRVREAFAVLREGAPDARVFVASIPDLTRLWEVGKKSRAARLAWDKLNICQALLARPTSKSTSDVARRFAVRDRVQAYNFELSSACGELGRMCRYDGGTVFAYQFTLEQLTRWDFFHPDKGGQRALAQATWRVGFWGDRALVGGATRPQVAR